MATDADGDVDLVARVRQLEAALAERDALIEQLVAKVAELTERLGRNSDNSHLPPSSDGPGAAARGERRSKKPRSKRKRGGQKGRRGAHRSLLPEARVDELVDLFPCACEGCAAPLPRTLDADARRYQMLELLVGRPYVTEWRRHGVKCPQCGHVTRAEHDYSTIPASPFGPRLQAVVAMLTGVYHLSRRRTRQLLLELFGIEISVGAISRIEARMSEALAPAFEEARRDVEAAAVKHTDATTWLRAGITMSLWTLCTAMTTVYCIVDDGCRATIRPLFGRLVGILVSDRASVFGFWDMQRRQVCWAHLLRKYVSFAQRDGPAGTLGRELLDCAALVFEYWRGFQQGLLTRSELIAWMHPVRRQLEAVLERAVVADIRGVSGSCADMLAHREALWTFVTHEGVEPTNNLAERDLRPLVLWRKRSFGSQSERGLRFVERVMTVAHTARKRGLDVLDSLVRCMTAQMSHAPAPALLGA